MAAQPISAQSGQAIANLTQLYEFIDDTLKCAHRNAFIVDPSFCIDDLAVSALATMINLAHVGNTLAVGFVPSTLVRQPRKGFPFRLSLVSCQLMRHRLLAYVPSGMLNEVLDAIQPCLSRATPPPSANDDTTSKASDKVRLFSADLQELFAGVAVILYQQLCLRTYLSWLRAKPDGATLTDLPITADHIADAYSHPRYPSRSGTDDTAGIDQCNIAMLQAICPPFMASYVSGPLLAKIWNLTLLKLVGDYVQPTVHELVWNPVGTITLVEFERALCRAPHLVQMLYADLNSASAMLGHGVDLSACTTVTASEHSVQLLAQTISTSPRGGSFVTIPPLHPQLQLAHEACATARSALHQLDEQDDIWRAQMQASKRQYLNPTFPPEQVRGWATFLLQPAFTRYRSIVGAAIADFREFLLSELSAGVVPLCGHAQPQPSDAPDSSEYLEWLPLRDALLKKVDETPGRNERQKAWIAAVVYNLGHGDCILFRHLDPRSPAITYLLFDSLEDPFLVPCSQECELTAEFSDAPMDHHPSRLDVPTVDPCRLLQAIEPMSDTSSGDAALAPAESSASSHASGQYYPDTVCDIVLQAARARAERLRNLQSGAGLRGSRLPTGCLTYCSRLQLHLRKPSFVPLAYVFPLDLSANERKLSALEVAAARAPRSAAYGIFDADVTERVSLEHLQLDDVNRDSIDHDLQTLAIVPAVRIAIPMPRRRYLLFTAWYDAVSAEMVRLLRAEVERSTRLEYFTGPQSNLCEIVAMYACPACSAADA